MTLQGISRGKFIQLFALIALLGLVFFTYAQRVDDLDFWWHLRSGQLIVQTGAIPQSDQLSYTTEITDTIGASLEGPGRPGHDFKHWSANLNHSWLGQCLIYLAYLAGSFKGVAILKSTVFAGAFLALYLAMRRARAWPTVSLLTVGLAAFIGRDFNYSRPQIFSFLLLAVLLYLLADLRRGGRKILALPPLMLVWANLHGGFIVGVAVLLLYAAGAVLQYLLKQKWPRSRQEALSRQQLRLLLITGGAALLLTLANPNGYTVYLVPLAIKQSIFVNFIEEYRPPQLYEYHAYWAMLLLTGMLLLFRLRRLDIPTVLVVLFLGAASLTGLRLIIFFAIGAGFALAVMASESLAWLGEKKFVAALARKGPLAAGWRNELVMLLLALAFSGLLIRQLFTEQILAAAPEYSPYPAAAVEFIRETGLPDRMFNLYDWGGYLTWQLPQYKTFIDGRCLSENLFAHYQQIIGTAAGGGHAPLWQRLLNAYQVQFILLPALTPTGYIVPLVDKLSIDPGWQLIHQDGTALIFLRKGPANDKRFQHLFLDNKPQRILDEVVAEARRGIERTPATWGYYETLGFVYMKRYELAEAKRMFEKYVAMNPNNIKVVQNLNFLRKLAGERPLPAAPVSPH